MRQIWTQHRYLGVSEVKPDRVCAKRCRNSLHSVIISIPPNNIVKLFVESLFRRNNLKESSKFDIREATWGALVKKKSRSRPRKVSYLYIIVFLLDAENICRDPDVADTTLRREIPAWDHNTTQKPLHIHLKPQIWTPSPRYRPTDFYKT